MVCYKYGCMNFDENNLPDDPELLKQMLIDLSLNHKTELAKEKEKYKHLQEKFKILQKMYFGKKSEKLTEEDKNQMYLFNEAETSADEEKADEVESDTKSIITVKGYTKKKPGRKPIPSDIPREEVIHVGCFAH